MNLRRFAVLLAVAGVSGFLSVACGGGDDGPKRTDIAQVDAVIEAVEERDRETVGDLIQFTSLPCSDSAGVAAQPRCLDEANGTNVDVFLVNECEPGWLRRDDLDELLDAMLAPEPEVYAAFNTPEGFYLPGPYAVVFEGDEPRVDEAGLKRYLAVGVEGVTGRITGVALGCGIEDPVHFLLPHLDEGFDDWLIEPDI